MKLRRHEDILLTLPSTLRSRQTEKSQDIGSEIITYNIRELRFISKVNRYEVQQKVCYLIVQQAGCGQVLSTS